MLLSSQLDWVVSVSSLRHVSYCQLINLRESTEPIKVKTSSVFIARKSMVCKMRVIVQFDPSKR